MFYDDNYLGDDGDYEDSGEGEPANGGIVEPQPSEDAPNSDK